MKGAPGLVNVVAGLTDLGKPRKSNQDISETRAHFEQRNPRHSDSLSILVSQLGALLFQPQPLPMSSIPCAHGFQSLLWTEENIQSELKLARDEG